MKKATHIFALSSAMLPIAAAVLLSSAARAAPAGEPSGAIAAPGPGSQTPGQAAAEPTAGDILVTARRRAENIQKVPVSVVALSGDALRQKEVKLVSDLTTVTPGAVIISAGSSTNPVLTLRGQTKGYGPGFPAVVTYLNEVPLPTYSSLIPTFDISSVQVLKGPQGTLFGRNTNGGAILAYTVAPNYTLNGYAEASYGNYNLREFQGAINIPIVDQHLAIRVATDLIKRDGFVKNLGVGGNLSDENSRAYRVSLLWQPASWLKNTLVADYFRAHENGTGNFIVSTAAPGHRFSDFFPALAPFFDCNVSPSCDVELAAAQAQKNGPRKEITNINPFSHNTIWGVSNTTTADLGRITLKNILGYRAVSFNLLEDADGTGLTIAHFPNRVGVQQFTEEFQASGTALDDKLTYIGGAFFLKDRPMGDNFLVVDIYRPPNVSVDTLLASESYFSSRSVAVFGQVDYDLSDLVDGLKATAGMRYTWDRITGCSTSAPFGGPRVGYDACRAGAGLNGAAKSSAPTWTVGLNYQATQDLFLYATSRRGYRGGGFNQPKFAPSLASVQTFSPEKLTDVELGVKANWRRGDMTGHANVTAYKGWFRNIQQNVIVAPNIDGDNNPADDPAGQTVIANGGRATIQGLEFDGLISPIHAVSFSALAAYTDAKFQSQTLPAVLAANVGTSAFQYTPKWSYTFSAQVSIPIPERIGKMIIYADYYHTDSYLGQDLRIPAWHVVNARLDWQKPFGSPLDVSLFVRNLFDKEYIAGPGIASDGLGFLSAVYGDPRTFGIRVRFNF